MSDTSIRPTELKIENQEKNTMNEIEFNGQNFVFPIKVYLDTLWFEIIFWSVPFILYIEQVSFKEWLFWATILPSAFIIWALRRPVLIIHPDKLQTFQYAICKPKYLELHASHFKLAYTENKDTYDRSAFLGIMYHNQQGKRKRFASFKLDALRFGKQRYTMRTDECLAFFEKLKHLSLSTW